MLITNTLSSVHTYLLDCINRFDVLKKKNTLEKVYQKKIKSKLNKEKTLQHQINWTTKFHVWFQWGTGNSSCSINFLFVSTTRRNENSHPTKVYVRRHPKHARDLISHFIAFQFRLFHRKLPFQFCCRW